MDESLSIGLAAVSLVTLLIEIWRKLTYSYSMSHAFVEWMDVGGIRVMKLDDFALVNWRSA
jgi:hypothetical protein